MRKVNKLLVTLGVGLCTFGVFQNAIIHADENQVSAYRVNNTHQNEITDNNVVMLDVARRKMTKQQIIDCINNIDSDKFQFLQLHLADNENFAIKTNILHNQDASNALSTSQLKSIVRYANSKGLQVIADVDVPAHAKGIINDLKNCDSPWLKQNIVMNDETLDYTNQNTINFVKQLYAEILPAFTSQEDKYFMIGADEVPGNSSYAQDFVNFINNLNDYLNRKGFSTIVWNDCLNSKVLNMLDTNITVDYWNSESDANTTPQDIINHGNPVKNADHNSSYYNTIDLKNRELRREKSNNLSQTQGSKMLCLWGSDSRQERKISNNEVISYIQQVQRKLDNN